MGNWSLGGVLIFFDSSGKVSNRALAVWKRTRVIDGPQCASRLDLDGLRWRSPGQTKRSRRYQHWHHAVDRQPADNVHDPSEVDGGCGNVYRGVRQQIDGRRHMIYAHERLDILISRNDRC